MALFRMYTGGDGQSHYEGLELSQHPELTTPTATKGIFFREWPVGHFIDWHPAPQRQYVILLSGELEIGFGDGSNKRFGAGDARLVEDTTGKGHTTRVVSDGLVLSAVVPLQ